MSTNFSSQKEREAANILLQLFLVSKNQKSNPIPQKKNENVSCCIQSCPNTAHNRNVGSLKYYHECNKNTLKRGYTKICDSCYQEDYNLHKKRRKNSPVDENIIEQQLKQSSISSSISNSNYNNIQIPVLYPQPLMPQSILAGKDQKIFQNKNLIERRARAPGNHMMIVPLRELGANHENSKDDRGLFQSPLHSSKSSFPLSHIHINE